MHTRKICAIACVLLVVALLLVSTALGRSDVLADDTATPTATVTPDPGVISVAPLSTPEPVSPNLNLPLTQTVSASTPYFYYFDSRPIPLSPVSDEVVLGLTGDVEEFIRFAAQQVRASNVERLDLGNTRSALIRLHFVQEMSSVHSALERLKTYPGIRFVSPVFSANDDVTRFFFADTITAEFKEGVSERAVGNILDTLVLCRERRARWDDNTWILRACDTRFNALEAANRLFESGLVEYAEPNFVFTIRSEHQPDQVEVLEPAVEVAGASGDYYPGWHLDKIRARDAWALVEGHVSYTPVVAVIDTGVQLDHPDLVQNMFGTGYDAVPNNYDGLDTGGAPYPLCEANGHGTEVAGVIAATDNDFGASGVARNYARIMPIRVKYLPECATELVAIDWVVDGVAWAYNNGADIINMSFGGHDVPMSQLFSVIKQAYLHGSVIVAAGGNDGSASIVVPACLPGVISVGGTFPDDTRWRRHICGCQDFPYLCLCGSNYGDHLDLVAPGRRVYTTKINCQYGEKTGTSHAAPQVAAVAALIRAVRPDITPTQIHHILQRTAQHVGPYQYDQRLEEGGWNREMGFGRVDAYEAVRAALYPVHLNFTVRLAWVEGENHSSEVAIAVIGPNSTGIGESRVIVSSGTATTDDSGNGYLQLYGIGPGTYTVCAKPKHYLGKCISTSLTPGQTTVIDFSEGGSYLFRPGDFNVGGEDGEVNGQDWAPFLSKWRSCIHTGDPVACQEADLDRNGTVNTRDIVIYHNTAGYAPKSDGSYPYGIWRPFGGAVEPAQTSTVKTASSPDVFFLGGSSNYNVGDIFDLQVWMDLRFAWPGVDSANMVIRYDPGVLDVIDADPDIPGTQISPGPLFPSYNHNIVDETAGVIRFSGYVGADDSPVQTIDRLATISFQAMAAISPTEVSIYLLPGETLDTNAAERDTFVDVLQQADNYTVVINGTPERTLPTVSIAPSSGDYIHTYRPTVSVMADDLWDQVQWVQVWAWYDADWHYVGTDEDGADGWVVQWDTTGIEDQMIYLWAYAALPGGQGGSSMSGPIALDRTEPEYSWHTFDPPSPSTADQVWVEVAATDNFVGVERIEMYVNSAPDGSSGGEWIYVGAVDGANGQILWDTTSLPDGSYQVAFAIKDYAGNWNRWQSEDLPTIVYTKGVCSIYLPLVVRGFPRVFPGLDLVGQVTGSFYAVFAQGNYVYVGNNQEQLIVIDVSQPSNPTIVGQVTVGSIEDITVVGGYAYLATGRTGIQIVDVSNPSNPAIVVSYDTPDLAYGIFVSGGFAYIADSSSGLMLIDVSDPTAPSEIATLDTSYAIDVFVTGNYAYIADFNGGLRVIDISNPAHPQEVDTYTPENGFAYGVFVSDGYAYVTGSLGEVVVLDVSDPTNVAPVGSCNLSWSGFDIVVSDFYAYVPDIFEALHVIDVLSPTNPREVWSYVTPGIPEDVAVVGDLVYVADSNGGLLVLSQIARSR